tara:strand:+ start:243 stop:1730 length:1488 start_codon:yes stop_codon:yes gene_type:complete
MITDNESFFDEKEAISENDLYNIIEYGIHVSELYMESYVSNMSNYNFEHDFEENINLMILTQFGKYFDFYSFFDDSDDNDDLVIDVIIREIMKSVYSHIVPRRSYNKTFIRKQPNIEKLSGQLMYLKSKPQPDQRTKEWYETRHNLITASNAWKCLDTQANQNQIIYEKCQPIVDRSQQTVNIGSTLHWGQKYEPLSTQLYEYLYNTKVDDFGCIIHDEYTFLGASPDGIVVNEESSRYGRMLEIKNIVNREITKIPKKEYWIQMQLQMEVCDLNECDFLETKFTEYEDFDEFYKDGNNFLQTEKLLYKGGFLMFMDETTPKYFYPEFQLKQESFNEWSSKILEENQHLQFIKTVYWKLDIFSCILVLRNKKWFNKSISKIEDLWKKVIYEREHGHQHRAPIKRERKPSIVDEPLNTTGCLIHDSSDEENNQSQESNNIDNKNLENLEITLDEKVILSQTKEIKETKETKKSVLDNSQIITFKIDTNDLKDNKKL